MFASPLGLLALLAVPAVIALHLYRRRFEPRVISALFLWDEPARQPAAGRKRAPLRRNPSLWCELGAAALLALAFAGPRAGCVAGRSEHLVVVLDSSASMSAVSSSGASAREHAIELVRGRIDALGRGSRVTLVASGTRPRLVAGPAAFPGEARDRQAEWRTRAARPDHAPAGALGLQLAGDARVVLVTDHYVPDAWPSAVEVVALGEPVDNWAITHAARTLERDDAGAEREQVFVTLASFAAAPRTLTVRVLADGRELAREPLELAPGARAHRAFRLADGLGPVAVQLEPDALALDDAVLLAPPPARTLGLFATLEREALAELGLAAGDDGIARWLALVPRSVAAPSAESAHLVLTRGAPVAAPAAWSLVLAELGGERRDLLGPFLAERAHAMLDGTTLEGLVWSSDPALALSGAPLVSAGNQPLLTEERRGARIAWHLNLDPARSSLQRTPDWPILLANMAELRRAALPGPERTSLAVGERLVYRPGGELAGVVASDEPLRYVLDGPFDPLLDSMSPPAASAARAQREIPALEQVLVDGLEEPGLYRLLFRGAAVAEVAVSFMDAAESDLRDARPGKRPAELESGRMDAELEWVELALVAAALALALLDWRVLARGAPIPMESGA
jgi:hypothetical protein